MILIKTHLQRCIAFLRKEGLRAPYFLRIIIDFRFSVVELVAKNGGEAEGPIGAGTPELNNMSKNYTKL